MNIKLLLPVLALSLTVASCSKEKTESTSMDTTVDSMALPAQDSAMTETMPMDSMQAVTPVNYVSNDGKTTFTLTPDTGNGTVVVKN